MVRSRCSMKTTNKSQERREFDFVDVFHSYELFMETAMTHDTHIQGVLVLQMSRPPFRVNKYEWSRLKEI